ncbi:hypothetical protein [Bradyrhizobium canariense]|nr:hypothetical protein [Bradyrhizobium canariense]
MISTGRPIPAKTDAALKAEAMLRQHIGIFRSFLASVAFATDGDNARCGRFFGQKDRRMTLLKVAAIVGTGLILTAAPALAGLVSPAAPQVMKPDSQIEQIRYRRSVLPEALIGGVISGVLGGVVGGNCYFNDCGYDNGPYYGGGYYGGGYGGGGRRGGFSRGGGRGGGGVRMSHAAVGGGHIGGGHAGGGHAGGGGHGGGRK